MWGRYLVITFLEVGGGGGGTAWVESVEFHSGFAVRKMDLRISTVLNSVVLFLSQKALVALA